MTWWLIITTTSNVPSWCVDSCNLITHIDLVIFVTTYVAISTTDLVIFVTTYVAISTPLFPLSDDLEGKHL